MRTFVVLLPSKGRVCSMRGVVKATTMAGSIVHILLIPERYLPYIGSSKPLGRTSESHRSKRGELQNAQSWEQAGQSIAEDQVQECGPLLKESWAHPLAVTA